MEAVLAPERLDQPGPSGPQESGEGHRQRVDVVELAKVKSQLNAAETSLKTNTILTVVIVFMFASSAVFSPGVNTINITIVKGLLPLAIAVVNFVKIQQLLVDYWQNFCHNINFMRQR